MYGDQGHPLRTTVSELGPRLLARLLGLNDTQTGVLNIAFQVADDEGLLPDLKDLRSLLQYVADQAKTLRTEYGNISAASMEAIQRSLLALEQQGGDRHTVGGGSAGVLLGCRWGPGPGAAIAGGALRQPGGSHDP